MPLYWDTQYSLHWGRPQPPACHCCRLVLSFRHNPLVEQDGISVACGKCLQCLSNGVPWGLLLLRPFGWQPSSDGRSFRKTNIIIQLFGGAFLMCSLWSVPTKPIRIPQPEVYKAYCPLRCPASFLLAHITSRITRDCSRCPHESSPALLLVSELWWPFFFCSENRK